jgi:hypothetical protein
MDWSGLALNRDRWRTLVSAVMSLRVPWNAGNFLTSCKPVSFFRRTLHNGVSEYICCYWIRKFSPSRFNITDVGILVNIMVWGLSLFYHTFTSLCFVVTPTIFVFFNFIS